MSELRLPILAVASLGDRLLCTPQAAYRFIRRTNRAKARFELIRRADDGGASPDHMQVVTTSRAASSWRDTASFCLG